MYRSRNIFRVIKSRRLRWAGHVDRMEECTQNFNKYIYREEVFSRPRRRWEGSIRMDLKEIGDNSRYWIDSAQDRENWRVNAALDLRVS